MRDEMAAHDDDGLLSDQEQPDHLSLAMFEGDTSTLFPELRLCLHMVLKHRYISAETHPEHWATLVDNEATIRSRLNDLFLDLEIDRQHQLAYKRTVSSETGDPLPSLVRNLAHTKEETIVMIALRQRYFSQRQEGDDTVFVDRETLLDEVADRRPDHATNLAMDHKRANKAIDSLVSANILRKTADPDRFEILGVIEVLMPIAKLRELLVWLMEANRTTDSDQTTDDQPDHGPLFDMETNP